ncbi:hypothetical protein GIB67_007181 [Kingdonia uniflora]|uniref:1-phosphatidylinositol-4-phosphate 5-kinase n=1 Tax=Kingdonia uniflora TaxID=39325 RepID=A0A7J7NDF2_9MAGN|nr:hypothetical protein GIB67_007181 [Kingdonia uniflora]
MVVQQQRIRSQATTRRVTPTTVTPEKLTQNRDPHTPKLKSGRKTTSFGISMSNNGDLESGFGKKRFDNGDFYEGSWRYDLQEGRGRYVWKNGNEFVGEWKNGLINGDGVLIWADGKRFDGRWENGVSKDCKLGEFDDLGLLGEFPLIYFIDNTAKEMSLAPECFGNDEVNKPGKTILKGHKNYDLMLNLQLTVRYSVGKPSSVLRDLRPEDFDSKEKYWTKFPREGSKFTPPHHSVEFKGKDYCPMVFRHLRELSGIDPADYMLAICGNDALRELSSPGKSGSFFYITQDDRFMIKTAKKSEVKVLLKMLRSYYNHVCSNKNSLITKFFGAHCVKPLGGQKIRFIIMGNLFCSESRIHRRFDLKGSSHGRITNKPEEEITETTTLKDLDLNFRFHLQRSRIKDLNRQINRDCEFLEGENIMDYSLLVGLHFCDDYLDDREELLPFVIPSGKQGLCQDEGAMDGFQFSEAKLQDINSVHTHRKSTIKLGANMPARAEEMVGRFNFPSQSNEIYEVKLSFGIIDILQDYDIGKKLEHAYKSLHADPTSISAVGPKLYSKRFRDFLHKIFVEDK